MTSGTPITAGTARTSEESKRSSSRFESAAGSTALSPIDDQTPPFLEHAFAESTGHNKLHKTLVMPTSSPPPPPPVVSSVPSVPPMPQLPPPPVPGAGPPPQLSQRPTVLTKPSAPTRPPPPRPVPESGRRTDRSPSPERPASKAKLQSTRLQPRNQSPSSDPRGRSVSAQPPLVIPVADGNHGSRAVSSPIQAGPPAHSGQHLLKPGTEGSPPPGLAADKRKRKSWFPGARSRANSDAGQAKSPGAWIMSQENQADYNTSLLVNGEKVPELWNEGGNVLVYLHPKEANLGPSFRVADHLVSNSPMLMEILVTEMMGATSHNEGNFDGSGALDYPTVIQEGHLYLPLGNTDVECLVAARNLFAFLTHQPLVGTDEHPNFFAALLQIAGLLRRFCFTSYDGNSFGDAVTAALDVFMDHTGIADVRHSREKTLEALILAEQLKSWTLYNEAFVHAVGKYELLTELRSPLYDRISVDTRQRMDRAHLDLVNRQASVNTRLDAFEFPSLFAGIASSTSTEEYRNVKFKEWRNSYAKMRTFVMGYYKGLFGNWPPRARSKKNHFSQSGLNRQCLKILYSDFCALYDLLVDRQSITPRVIGEGYDEEADSSQEKDKKGDRAREASSISALRKVLGEFDKSSPPVLPPIPFDVPKLPSMTAIYENYHDLPAKKQAKYSKSVQPHELQLILLKSRNIDTDALHLPFLDAFKDFELRESRGTHPSDLADQRIGNWLFLYVVLQSLPMLVVDAPGLRYTEGVEDFLCQAPKGNPPWTEDAGQTRKMWFQTTKSNVVELSADVVMFSVEGTYMRSHCWLAAKDWDAGHQGHHGQQQHTPTTQSPAPSSPHLLPHARPRSGSDDRARQAFRASIAIGLEPLPLPAAPHPPTGAPGAAAFDRASRVMSLGSMSGLSSSAAGMGAGTGTWSPSGTGTPGTTGSAGPGSPAFGPVGGTGSSGNGNGNGNGDMYQLGLRVSRSAANLGQLGGSGGDYLSAGGAGGQPRKSSYGAFGIGPSNLGPGGGGGGDPGHGHGHGHTQNHGHGHAVRDSMGGGSTFDDILKGMDDKGKKKKKLFF
ncbi:uncharacterized protein C8A04DRAFT_38967 [Dichotomopilus funicola]|uniref:DUF8004 domain-containing protein n=1 Tax=Dichotomopilus funicola TaxID=1934379 RepID=A0AAN6V121_9PEZI|nr:hypothetical protein C8A04DRAFT_38967 [Dichotomopilus funicola]